MSDRVVHAEGPIAEVVRYDGSGKWYIERFDGSGRKHVGVHAAVRYATSGCAIFYGRSGGKTFDRLCRSANSQTKP